MHVLRKRSGTVGNTLRGQVHLRRNASMHMNLRVGVHICTGCKSRTSAARTGAKCAWFWPWLALRTLLLLLYHAWPWLALDYPSACSTESLGINSALYLTTCLPTPWLAFLLLTYDYASSVWSCQPDPASSSGSTLPVVAALVMLHLQGLWRSCHLSWQTSWQLSSSCKQLLADLPK